MEKIIIEQDGKKMVMKAVHAPTEGCDGCTGIVVAIDFARDIITMKTGEIGLEFCKLSHSRIVWEEYDPEEYRLDWKERY